MGLAGKFVFFNHAADPHVAGDRGFCQYGEVVEDAGQGFYVLIKWDCDYGDPGPHSAAMTLVPLDDMIVLPGEDEVWQVFATREELDAYKKHLKVQPIGDDEPDTAKVVRLASPRTH